MVMSSKIGDSHGVSRIVQVACPCCVLFTANVTFAVHFVFIVCVTCGLGLHCDVTWYDVTLLYIVFLVT